MKVSIVMPAFNAAPLIGRALQSIANQTHSNWELIVIDDASADGTTEQVEAFGRTTTQAVQILRNEENLGVSRSRNRGLRVASGDVLAFLDADDFWTPDHLVRGVNELVQSEGIAVSDVTIYDRECDVVLNTVTLNSDVKLGRNMGLRRLFQRCFIQTSSSAMVTKQAAEHVGEFEVSLQVGEDWDFWLRTLAEGYSLKCTGEATCFYNKHAGNTMYKTLLVAENHVRFYRKHMSTGVIPMPLRRNQLSQSLSDLGRLIRSSDPSRASRLFLQSWCLRPWQLVSGLRAVVALFTRLWVASNRE